MNETGTIDIQALLAEIEQKVAEKKAAGIYDPVEVRRVEEEALSFSQAETIHTGDAERAGSTRCIAGAKTGLGRSCRHISESRDV